MILYLPKVSWLVLVLDRNLPFYILLNDEVHLSHGKQFLGKVSGQFCETETIRVFPLKVKNRFPDADLDRLGIIWWRWRVLVRLRWGGWLRLLLLLDILFIKFIGLFGRRIWIVLFYVWIVFIFTVIVFSYDWLWVLRILIVFRQIILLYNLLDSLFFLLSVILVTFLLLLLFLALRLLFRYFFSLFLLPFLFAHYFLFLDLLPSEFKPLSLLSIERVS